MEVNELSEYDQKIEELRKELSLRPRVLEETCLNNIGGVKDIFINGLLIGRNKNSSSIVKVIENDLENGPTITYTIKLSEPYVNKERTKLLEDLLEGSHIITAIDSNDNEYQIEDCVLTSLKSTTGVMKSDGTEYKLVFKSIQEKESNY
jgi:hypothetical protein